MTLDSNYGLSNCIFTFDWNATSRPRFDFSAGRKAVLAWLTPTVMGLFLFLLTNNLFSEKTTDDFENLLLPKCGKVVSWCRCLGF